MKFGITYAIVSGRQPIEEMFQESVSQIQLAESCVLNPAAHLKPR